MKEDKNKPCHWTLGYSLDVELGFDDGTYLPRKAALILHPEYFDEYGNPILEMLPMARPNNKKKRRWGGIKFSP